MPSSPLAVSSRPDRFPPDGEMVVQCPVSYALCPSSSLDTLWLHVLACGSRSIDSAAVVAVAPLVQVRS